MNKICWSLLDEHIGNILLWTSTHGHTNIGWPTKTYIHQHYPDTGCRLEDLTRVMADMDEWQESQGYTCCLHALMIYIYISSSWSSCCAASTDIPDPLSPLLPIVHRLWQVFRATSRILTELLYVCLSWYTHTPFICNCLLKYIPFMHK